MNKIQLLWLNAYYYVDLFPNADNVVCDLGLCVFCHEIISCI